MLGLSSIPISASTFVLHGLSKHPHVEHNAKRSLQDHQPKTLQNISTGAIDRLAQQGLQTLKTALQPYGYFSPSMRYTLHTEAQRSIHYWVTLGPQTTLKHFDFAWVNLPQVPPALLEAQKAWHWPLGEPYTAKRYEQQRQALLDAVMARGYSDAHFTKAKTIINIPKHSATVQLRLDPGLQHRIAAVHFDCPGYTPEFLERFLPFQIGELYTSRQLALLEQHLENARLFSRIALEPQVLADQSDVTLHVRLTPRKRQHIDAGLGYSTDTGYNVLLDSTWYHLGAGGQQFHSKLALSEAQKNLTLNYTQPGHRPSMDRYLINTIANQNKDKKSSSRSLMLQWVSSRLRQDWQQVLSLNSLYESISPTDADHYTTHIVYPKIDYTRLSSDDHLHPTRGSRTHVSALLAQDLQAHSTTFVALNMDYARLMPLRYDYSAYMSLGFGGIWGKHLGQLPLSLQYYAGGVQNLRGYTYHAFGPGRFFKHVNLEIRHPIKHNMQWAVFWDQAMASDQASDKLHQSAGVALLWQSLVGTFKISLGKPLDQDQGSWRLQFNITQPIGY